VRTWQELNTFNNGESGYNALKRLCEWSQPKSDEICQ
jgi:hypothetical protein